MLRGIKYYLDTLGLVGTCKIAYVRLTGGNCLVGMQPSGIKTKFFLRVPSSDVSMYRQIFVDNEYESFSRDPKVIVDAGANIGLASILFANRYPNTRILAIEPERANFKLLERNTRPYANVTPIQAALWHEAKEIKIHDPGRGACGFQTSETGGGHSVSTVTIDQLLSDYAINRISILKVDIEGAEKEVFEHSSSWIGKVDSIIIELHDRFKPGCKSSFYNGASGFDTEWRLGENVYLSKNGALTSESDH